MSEPIDSPQYMSDMADLAGRVVANQVAGTRQLIAIVGAPGSGKSTLSDALAEHINKGAPGSCAVVPMDGFHFDDAILEARGTRARKGAPHTYDVDGLINLHGRLLAKPYADIAVPVFDRSMELSRASARIIPASLQTILVEGNYLLLQQAPWDELRSFYDLTIMIDEPLSVLEQRLTKRWQHYGLEGEAFRAKMEGNDLPNARLVIETSAAPDLFFSA
ncbi:MAG: nucleoside/nucleotide kinase family protein [Devosiaceae bacterium]